MRSSSPSSTISAASRCPVAFATPLRRDSSVRDNEPDSASKDSRSRRTLPSSDVIIRCLLRSPSHPAGPVRRAYRESVERLFRCRWRRKADGILSRSSTADRPRGTRARRFSAVIAYNPGQRCRTASRDVRAEQHVVEVEQRAVGLDGLPREDVEGRTGHRAGPDRVGERPSRPRPARGPRSPRAPREEAVRAGVPRSTPGCPRSAGPRPPRRPTPPEGRRAAGVARRARVRPARVVGDLAPERREQLSTAAIDVTEPDQTDPTIAEIPAVPLSDRRLRPPPAAHLGVRPGDRPTQVRGGGDRPLGHRRRISAGSVRDRYTGFGPGVDVDVGDTDARLLDQPQGRPSAASAARAATVRSSPPPPRRHPAAGPAPRTRCGTSAGRAFPSRRRPRRRRARSPDRW